VKYRSVFISDVHLGSRGCKAEDLLDFLDSIECSYLFLVGDIIDIWKLQGSWYWPHSHNKIVRKLIKKSRDCQVVFVPGNHDEMFRDFDGLNFGEIEIHREYEHRLAGGQKVLVIHGDRFDRIVCHSKWLAKLGGHAYEILVRVNSWYNAARKRLGMKYWSLAGYLKLKTKKALKIVDNFEEALTTHAASEEFSAVVCGHIHRAEVKLRNGVTYANCGDWVESRTAIVETMDGELKVIQYGL